MIAGVGSCCNDVVIPVHYVHICIAILTMGGTMHQGP